MARDVTAVEASRRQLKRKLRKALGAAGVVVLHDVTISVNGGFTIRGYGSLDAAGTLLELAGEDLRSVCDE